MGVFEVTQQQWDKNPIPDARRYKDRPANPH
jgi:hypothetical protein